MKKRHAGIELLRLVAMLMIVICHVIIWTDLDRDLWLTGLAALGGLGVNIYGLITGYVSYTEEEKQFKPGKYWRTWLVAFVYSVGFMLLWKVSAPEQVSSKMIFLSFFPVASAQWWYFSSWTALFFLQPLLLILVRNLQCKHPHIYILIFSFYATAVGLFSDPFNLGWGYSALWLCMLYVVGAMLKKYNVVEKISSKTVLWLLAAALLCLLFGTPVIGKLSAQFLGSPIASKLLTDYTSPLIILSAVLAVLAFSKVDFHGKAGNVFAYVGAASFGIYIIHCHPYVNNFVKERHIWQQDRSTLESVLLVLVAAIAIFTASLLIELIRMLLFKAVEKFIKRIQKKEDVL